MSKIGNKPLILPESINVYQLTTSEISISNSSETFKIKIPFNFIYIVLSNKTMYIKLNEYSKDAHRLQGLYRSLIYNAIIGLQEGYTVELNLIGIGYKASVENDIIQLRVGFTHLINIKIPADINCNISTLTHITLKSANKESVTNFAAKIRSIRPPEPYKGKGILYEGEKIKLKPGKSKK